MKKSQLRKIIKESIKQLMTEQPGPYNGTHANVRTCTGGATHQNYCVPYSNPQIGDAFEITNYFNASWIGRKVFIRNLMGPCSIVQNGITNSVTPFTGCCINCDTYNDWSGYPPSGACLNSCSSQSTGCQQSDFQYASSTCGAQHLQPAPGGANSWNGWLNLRWNGYQAVGCQHIQNIINWVTPQLPNVSGVQLARKQAKIDWAGCMLTHCSC